MDVVRVGDALGPRSFEEAIREGTEAGLAVGTPLAAGASMSPAEVREVTDGLWVWRLEHPDWRPDAGWEPPVTSVWIECGGETAVVDGWRRRTTIRSGSASTRGPRRWRSCSSPTTSGTSTSSCSATARVATARYLYWPDNIPETKLHGMEPGAVLPGGIVALYDGRGRSETPIWVPDQRALVFADALTERRGELLVWGTPWHEERVLPALRAMLELPFEHVIVSHGQPVHDRAAFERALSLPPFVE